VGDNSKDEVKAEMGDRELYFELVKMHEESVKHRRDHEWKLAFGFWSAIGLSTWFVASEKISLPESALFALAILYFLLWLTAKHRWFTPLQRAHHTDRRWKHYFIKVAEGRLSQAELEKEKPPQKDEFGREYICPFSEWQENTKCWYYAQVVFTGIFLIMSFMMILITAVQNAPPAGKNAMRPPVTSAQ
jgi:hypothetical protein